MKSFFPFYKDGKCGFIDASGNEIIPPMYEYGEHSTEGLAIARQNGSLGFIDSDNSIVVPFCHKAVTCVKGGFFFSWGKGFYNLDNKSFSNAVS